MPKINTQFLKALDSTPPNPKNMHQALGNVVLKSSTCRAKVESVNPETGEYRIVLTGTIVNEPTHTNPNPNTNPNPHWKNE